MEYVVDLDADVYHPPVTVQWTDADGTRRSLRVNPNRYGLEEEIAFGRYVALRQQLLREGKTDELLRVFAETVAEQIAPDNPEWTKEEIARLPSKLLGKVQLFFVSPDAIPQPSSVAAVAPASPAPPATPSTPAPPAESSFHPLPQAA